MVYINGLGKSSDTRLNVVDVAVVKAILMGTLARVPFYGHSDLLIGGKMPHDVDDIASILGTELDTELTPHLSVTQAGDLLGWSQIVEFHGDILLGSKLDGGAHFLCGNHQAVSRSFLNLSIRHIKIVGS